MAPDDHSGTHGAGGGDWTGAPKRGTSTAPLFAIPPCIQQVRAVKGRQQTTRAVQDVAFELLFCPRAHAAKGSGMTREDVFRDVEGSRWMGHGMRE